MPKNKYYDKLKIFNVMFQLNTIIHLFYFQFLIKSIKSQCGKETPILFENTCQLKACSKEQFENQECKIENKVVKTQWLTSIIQIGDKDYRYINFANFSNGDMVVETSACPSHDERMFYGITSDGSPLFKKSSTGNTKTYFFTIKVPDQTDNGNKNTRYESENFIITVNEGLKKGTEYLVSFAKSTQYAELYMFDEINIKQKQTLKVLGNQMDILKFTSIKYINNNNYYILLGYYTNNYIYLSKLYFKANDFTDNNPQITNYKYSVSIGGSLSCFITKSNYIICAYIKTSTTSSWYGGRQITSTTYSFCRNAFTETFNSLKEACISTYIPTDTSIFVKGIHLKEDIGAFTYFNFYNSHTYPILFFEKYYNYVFSSICSNSYYGLYEISNNNNIFFNNYCLRNDLIKIKEDKLCYITASDTNTTLYIIIINIFGTKVTVRYYSIDIFGLYNYKILLDMRGHLYNNYIAIAFSYCPGQFDCTSDKIGDHYSTLLIFSYLNKTQSSLNIEKYLFDNNDIKINNLIVNMKKTANVKIENNLFGNIFYGINIKENGCNNLDIFSYITKNKININETIEGDKIIIKFKDNAYSPMNCVLKLSYIFTEPNYDDYQQYVFAEETSTGYSMSLENYNTQKDLYEGKLSNYEILIENELLTNGCGDYCELCLNVNYCITCQYNYTFEEDGNGIKNKICLEPVFETDVLEKEKEEEREEERE